MNFGEFVSDLVKQQAFNPEAVVVVIVGEAGYAVRSVDFVRPSGDDGAMVVIHTFESEPDQRAFDEWLLSREAK